MSHNASFPQTESVYTVTHVAQQSPLPPSSPPLTKSPGLIVVLTISIVICLIFVTEIHAYITANNMNCGNYLMCIQYTVLRENLAGITFDEMHDF